MNGESRLGISTGLRCRWAGGLLLGQPLEPFEGIAAKDVLVTAEQNGSQSLPLRIGQRSGSPSSAACRTRGGREPRQNGRFQGTAAGQNRWGVSFLALSIAGHLCESTNCDKSAMSNRISLLGKTTLGSSPRFASRKTCRGVRLRKSAASVSVKRFVCMSPIFPEENGTLKKEGQGGTKTRDNAGHFSHYYVFRGGRLPFALLHRFRLLVLPSRLFGPLDTLVYRAVRHLLRGMGTNRGPLFVGHRFPLAPNLFWSVVGLGANGFPLFQEP